MDRLFRIKIFDLLCWVVILITALIVFPSVFQKGMGGAVQGLTQWREGWYREEEGHRTEVTLPTELDGTGEMTLYHDTILEECGGEMLSMRGAQYGLKILAGEKVLFDSSHEAFARNDQMASKRDCNVKLSDQEEGQRLAIVLTDVAKGNGYLGVVYTGAGEAVYSHCLREDFGVLAAAFMMVVLGLVGWLIALYLRKSDLREQRFAYIGTFLLLCGIWCATDSSYAQLVQGDGAVLNYISFFVFMLLAVPMLQFVDYTLEGEPDRFLAAVRWLFYANFIIQAVLDYLGIFTLVQMLFVTHILLVIGVVCAGLKLRQEYEKTGETGKRQEILFIARAVGFLFGGGVLALLLYWAWKIPYYEVFFEISIIIFVVIILRGLTDTVVTDVGYKAEMMVYERMALEDRLTGMKNKRAFEEMMQTVSEDASQYKDAVLIFMDLNRLKQINDRYGHSAGDEMIIAAGLCIQETFGKKGPCYRIGGDEFCCVIIDPEETVEELLALLDDKVSTFNLTGKYKLSIAKGAGCLRDDQNRVKAISDWKMEADMKMYENKQWQKKNNLV